MTSPGRRLVTDGPAGESPAERRHRTLSELKRTVRHHPAVTVVTGTQGDDGRFRDLEVTFDPLMLGVDADHAALRIEWRPRPAPTEPAHFAFHYHDTTGRDFGWHREPNPHVDGLEQYQERAGAEQEYDDQSVDVDPNSPVDLLWTILGWIEERLSSDSV